MNSVKANRVKNIAGYPWSCYWHITLGEKNMLITEHRLYWNSAKGSALRAKNYQKLFDTLNTSNLVQQGLQHMEETETVKL